MIANDKLGHIKMCAGIALVASLLTTPQIGIGVAMVVGVGKELWDLCGFGTPEWADLGADLVGSIIGTGVAICIKFLMF